MHLTIRRFTTGNTNNNTIWIFYKKSFYCLWFIGRSDIYGNCINWLLIKKYTQQ